MKEQVSYFIGQSATHDSSVIGRSLICCILHAQLKTTPVGYKGKSWKSLMYVFPLLQCTSFVNHSCQYTTTVPVILADIAISCLPIGMLKL